MFGDTNASMETIKNGIRVTREIRFCKTSFKNFDNNRFNDNLFFAYIDNKPYIYIHLFLNDMDVYFTLNGCKFLQLTGT